MHSAPTKSHLEWAAHAVGPGSTIHRVESLHDGSSPWRLTVQTPSGTREVVLRVAGWIPPAGIVTGATTLRVAEDHQLPAPRLLAADLDGRLTGRPAALETYLPDTGLGSVATNQHLQSFGAMLARVHKVHLAPTDELPMRVRPVQVDDYALERRWANLSRASEPAVRPAIAEALSELTGWPIEASERTLQAVTSSPLMQLAEERVNALDRPAGPTTLLHGDVHPGNSVWSGKSCTGLIDWKTAGVGDPGVDLGNLRRTMAVQYGQHAAEDVLQGWKSEAGRPAANVAYWDVVAALNTPTVLWPQAQAFDEQGNRLEPPAGTERRNQFLRSALDRLEPSDRIPRVSRFS